MTNARRLALLPLAALLAVPWVPVAHAQTTGAVQAGSLKFTPPTINVAVGGKVTWTNADGVFHTVTGGKDGAADSASPIGNAILDTQGKTHEVTFTAAGTYDYFCSPHFASGMVGQVVVGGGGGAAASPTASAAVTPAPSSSVSVAPSASPSVSATAEAAEGGEFVVPGIEDNAVLNDIKARRAAEERTTKGFLALMGGATAAMVALSVALIASTRRRPS